MRCAAHLYRKSVNGTDHSEGECLPCVGLALALLWPCVGLALHHTPPFAHVSAMDISSHTYR